MKMSFLSSLVVLGLIGLVCFTANPASAAILNDEKDIAWASRRDLTSQQFSDAFDEYRQQGLMMIDVDAYPQGRGVRYSMVWRQNTDRRGWAEHRDMTSQDYGDKWEEYKNRGFRPLDVEAYQNGGQQRWAGIWVENKEGLAWSSHRGLTSDAYGELFQEKVESGFRLVDMEVYRTSDGLRYTAIWYENTDNRSWAQLRDMTRERYQQEVDARSRQGMRVVDYESYQTSNGQRYAAIWEAKPGFSWQTRTDRTERQFANLWRQYRDQGYRLVDFERYDTSSGPRYAGIWAENDERYAWSGRSQAEQALATYAGNADIPGVGAAIIRNGRVIFQGGAGFADAGQNITAHSGTVYRLASVAKAITGTLAYDLEEAGIINDLDDRTNTIISGLGTQHNHSVRQLLQNTGCVKHYTNDGLNDNATQIQYNTAQAALNQHMDGAMKTNDWIIPGCSLGTRNYSTHGYTLAAAALEVSANSTFADLIKNRIADPLGLDTLRVENRSFPNSSGERATINSGTTQVSNGQFQNVSWKAGGSGMESSALDLALFGDAVLRNRYFPQATRDDIWSGGTGNGRAHGWSLNAAGTQVTKGGDNQGSDSHIRIDIGNGITVVALTNTNPPSVDTSTLTQQLLDIAVANP